MAAPKAAPNGIFRGSVIVDGQNVEFWFNTRRRLITPYLLRILVRDVEDKAGMGMPAGSNEGKLGAVVGDGEIYGRWQVSPVTNIESEEEDARSRG